MRDTVARLLAAFGVAIFIVGMAMFVTTPGLLGASIFIIGGAMTFAAQYVRSGR